MSGGGFHVHGPHDHELEHAAQHGSHGDSHAGGIAVVTAIIATVGAMFAYMGGATHQPDVAEIAEVLLSVLARHGATVRLQFWGGQGYMWESRISRIMRDIRLTAIGGGANEIMLQVIAKQMGLSSGKGRKAQAAQ